jgi:hypothetical protein
MLNIPEEFKIICINFQPYATDDYESEDKFIEFSVSELNSSQRIIASEFIDKIVDSELSEEELESLFRKAGSYLRISPEEDRWARNYLKRIQKFLT